MRSTHCSMRARAGCAGGRGSVRARLAICSMLVYTETTITCKHISPRRSNVRHERRSTVTSSRQYDVPSSFTLPRNTQYTVTVYVATSGMPIAAMIAMSRSVLSDAAARHTSRLGVPLDDTTTLG